MESGRELAATRSDWMLLILFEQGAQLYGIGHEV